MLELLQSLFILPLIVTFIIIIIVYIYHKTSHQDEEYTKRDYIRYFVLSYLSCLGIYVAYQKFTTDSVTTSSSLSGGGGDISDIATATAECAENLVDNNIMNDTTYGIMNNIMERFNTGRPTF